MFEPVLKALLLGLSTGAVCLGYCAPVFLPLMLAEERKPFRAKLMPFLQFIAGRFIAYLVFGLIVGWAGARFGSKSSDLVIGLSFLGLAVLMVLYGLQGGFPNLSLCKALSPFWQKARAPFLFGMLMGLNFCPPFLAAFADVFVAGRIWYGLVFFFVFFLVTSVFLVPYLFVGYLSSSATLRTIARFAALITGVLFLFFGLVRIFS